MNRDLREFINLLNQKLPSQFLQIEQPIDAKFEITTLLTLLEEEHDKYPGILFTNVKNLKGKLGNRVITNITADRQLMALAVGLEPEQCKLELTSAIARMVNRRIDPVVVEPGKAPVKEIKINERDVDLRDLPILTHHQMDANPYCTMVNIVKKSNELGYNLAYHRNMYKSPKSLGIHMAPYHTYAVFREYEKRNEPTPVVIVHGHHPAFNLAGVYMSPWPWEEYAVAGAFLREPVRLTSSETWGDEFMVPADAEILIEGEIQPWLREPEAPFGEWTGYYGPQRQNPVIQVKAITHRRDYIWVDTNIGHLDSPDIGWEAAIFSRVEDALPGSVRGVYGPDSGREGFHVYISINKISEGIPAIAACAAQTIGLPKLIIVVDEDINPYNEKEVLFALATRFQADRDLNILKNVRGSVLDPSNVHPTLKTSLFLDATKSSDKPYMERVNVPPELKQRLSIKDFIPDNIMNSVKPAIY
jgi:2,5-furandicarboxylate decarboxylase 1